MNWLRRLYATGSADAMRSDLYNEATFYKQFIKDVLRAKEEVIIESPYITKKRLGILKPIFEKLINKGIHIFIITRNPQEHDVIMAEQAESGIRFEMLGAQVLLIEGGHHRKLALIDRKSTWEGSLNILSQSCSREFMRRIESKALTAELFHFLQFNMSNIFKKNLDLL